MTFETLPDLASRALGGSVVAANDEFFAARDNLVNPEPPTFTPRTFGAKGQVYDGWETRRRREPGDDHATVRLGVPGVVRGVVVDTAFFTGNYPPYASVEGCGAEGYPSPDELTGWFPLVPRAPLHGDTRNLFTVDDPRRVTHVRLRIYPDGGVARLRVHGEALPDPRLLPPGPVDLAAMEYGGQVVGCSDMHYGSPANLILPGLARVMGEGWETRRRRDDGHDWVEVRLAAPGRVRLAELDTSHFKGNAPGAAALLGRDAGDWFPLLPRTRLQPDTRHRFRLAGSPPVTHVRLEVYPDGGMARLRLYGDIAPPERDLLALRWFNALPADQALAVAGLLPEAAARALVAGRPLTDPTRLDLGSARHFDGQPRHFSRCDHPFVVRDEVV
ncbi:MAG TPA: allantoicase [Rugosimonospora sp.]|nr:allantoicase [Rugosimonospora sp.]